MKKNFKFSNVISKRLRPALIVAVSFGVAGSTILFVSHAATPVTSLEAESGQIIGNASTVSDTTGSGNGAVKFGPAPSATTDPSGQIIPSGNLTYGGHTFTRSFADDFTTNVALGSWPGPYASTWSGYTDGTKDSCGNNADCGTTSIYEPSKVLSVSNGELDWYLHTENGVHMSAAPWPNSGTPFTYGAYSFRFKADSIFQTSSLTGFKTAWLLWPASWQWTDEVDFPEGDLSGNIGAFGHCYSSTANASSNCAAPTTTSKYSSWHTSTVVWTPGNIDFLLDGVLIGSQTTGVSSESMRILMQTESCFDSASACPANSTAGHLDLDWIVMYNY